MSENEFRANAKQLAEKLTPGMDTFLRENFDPILPGLADSIAEIAYGHVYSRPGLAKEKRYLVSIAAIVSQGPQAEPQLRANVAGALRAGVTKTEIAEAIFQVSLYAGLSNALNSLAIAKSVFEETGA